ncbi:MAG TPA: hypothetical protein VN761_02030 [Candidatus Polarisedimenticolia bacterium]|nr:hypothetical protein [Candidatus Polarisedimenticolia bacterium]
MGTGLLLMAGCAGTVYTSGGAGYYAYDYYPDWDVYYYPNDRVYYWYDGGHWRSGHRVPGHYRLDVHHREQLQLHSRQPWMEHRPERPEFQEHYRGDRR